jgi:flagellar basal body-associated protein FliL
MNGKTLLHFLLKIFTVLIFFQAGSGTAQQLPKIALVIGNAAYKNSPLRNPENDAKDFAKSLKGFGFTVIERTNLTTKQIGPMLREFRSKLVPGSVAVIFYAGHGLQIKGENYLPTVDADIQGEEDVPQQSLSTRQLMDVLAESGTRMNLVFLDACRNNPYSRRFRSTTRGLSRENAPSGTLISFATRPGSEAADGDGRNGLYTSVLLQQLKLADQPIEQVLKKVVAGVKQASNGQQEPWIEGSIEGDFCFAECIGIPATSLDAENSAWETASKTNTRASYQTYLAKYPKGKYESAAKLALKALKSGEESVPLRVDTHVETDNQRWKFNYYAFKNPLRSNLTGLGKVMKITLTVMTHYDDRVIKNVKTHENALRAGILDLMRQKAEVDLRKPDFRKMLAEEVRLIINSLLEKYEGFGGIEEVIFTEFVVE